MSHDIRHDKDSVCEALGLDEKKMKEAHKRVILKLVELQIDNNIQNERTVGLSKSVVVEQIAQQELGELGKILLALQVANSIYRMGGKEAD